MSCCPPRGYTRLFSKRAARRDAKRYRREGLDDLPASRPLRSSNVSQRDGSFAVRVPGDRPVTLVAEHPQLVPAPDGGRVEVREPREGVVLRLVDRAALERD